MEFEPTDEQRQIKEEVGRFADNEIRPGATEYDREEKAPLDLVERGADMEDHPDLRGHHRDSEDDHRTRTAGQGYVNPLFCCVGFSRSLRSLREPSLQKPG